MAKSKSPFRKGRAKISKSGSGGSQFLSIKDGESITFAPLVGLDEMISADMHEYWDIRPAIFHPCIGRGCPGCQVENEPRFKGYLPVLVKDTGETAIYPFTVSVNNQLEELEDSLEDGTIKGFVIKVSRKGTSLKTRYNVLGLGSRVDVSGTEIPDFIPQLGPQTEDEIWDLLEANGFGRTGESAPAKAAEASDDDDGWGGL